jgi:tRNA pseudouridine55 synthase
MKKNKKNINNSGLLLINKKEGPTSHDIINQLRKITNIKKIGHAGTLDPFATGLLIIAISRKTTKKISSLVKLDKKYIAEIKLGIETDSYDKTGKTIKKYKGEKIKKKKIKENLKIIEKQEYQTPPMYSAKKIKGKKLYELARKGIEIDRPPQKIQIYHIKFKKYHWPKLKIEIHCSSGTYIRSIAHDLGKKLKCGAHLNKLKRTQIGNYHLKKAIEIKKLNKNNWNKYLFDNNN